MKKQANENLKLMSLNMKLKEIEEENKKMEEEIKNKKNYESSTIMFEYSAALFRFKDKCFKMSDGVLKSLSEINYAIEVIADESVRNQMENITRDFSNYLYTLDNNREQIAEEVLGEFNPKNTPI